MNKEYFKKYYRLNKVKLDAYHKEYVNQHRKEIRDYYRSYQQKRKAMILEERKQKLLNEINQAK